MGEVIIGALIAMVVALIAGIPVAFSLFLAVIIITLSGGYDLSEIMNYGFMDMSTPMMITIPMLVFITIVIERCGVLQFNREEKLQNIILDNLSATRLVIPPSITIILYVFVVGQSAAACFAAMVIPAIILLALIVVVAAVMLKISKTPEKEDKEIKPDGRKLLSVVPVPIIIFVGIISGVINLIEATALAVIYMALMGRFYYKKLDWESTKEILIETATKTGNILFILLSGIMLSRLLAMENLPYIVADKMLLSSEGGSFAMISIIIVMVVAGIVVGKYGGILLMAPIMAQAIIFIGANPVQFGVITVLSIGLGQTIMSVKGKCKWVFILIAWVPTLIITVCNPQLSLFLPQLLGVL